MLINSYKPPHVASAQSENEHWHKYKIDPLLILVVMLMSDPFSLDRSCVSAYAYAYTYVASENQALSSYCFKKRVSRLFYTKLAVLSKNLSLRLCEPYLC